MTLLDNASNNSSDNALNRFADRPVPLSGPGRAVEGFDSAGRSEQKALAQPLTGHTNVAVLVIGAGPVGLVTALLLARRGVKVLVIERHAGTSIHPKARGVSPRSMEIFRELGIADGLWQQSLAITGGRAHLCVTTTMSSPQTHRFPIEADIDEDQGITPYRSTLAAQDLIEARLLDLVLLEPNVDIRFRSEFVSLHQNDDAVSVAVTHRLTGEQATVSAQYVVAADGGKSPVREQLGIGIDGERDLASNINVLFDADLSQFIDNKRSVLYAIGLPGAQGAILAVDGERRWLYNFPLVPGETVDEYDEGRLILRIRCAIGDALIPISVVSAVEWQTNAFVTDQYRAGRVLLAGDAAHVTPPNGAFGMNIGVQDAHNLAWKLAAVLAEEASPALLDTYEAERKPVARATVAQALVNLRQSPMGAGPGGPQRPTGGSGPAGGGDHAGRLLLGYRYASDAISGGDPQPVDYTQTYVPAVVPGERLPHAWVRFGQHVVSTHDIVAGRFTVVAGSDAELTSAKLQLHNGLAIPVQRIGVDILPMGDPTVASIAALHDEFALTTTGAILVRPDGFVGWTQGSGVTDVNVRDVVQRLLSVPSPC
jgi:putative polyketide hydroxylase